MDGNIACKLCERHSGSSQISTCSTCRPLRCHQLHACPLEGGKVLQTSLSSDKMYGMHQTNSAESQSPYCHDCLSSRIFEFDVAVVHPLWVGRVPLFDVAS